MLDHTHALIWLKFVKMSYISIILGCVAVSQQSEVIEIEPRVSKLRERNLSRCVNGIHTILPTRGFELNVVSVVLVMKSAKHLTWTWGIERLFGLRYDK